ncbi:MAG TPA: RagB/SusD family nutrient uptake outer membrane protein [Flavitalea sp.]|nr:RagB/SusD family nutrient uptake outer membrane protein [Flavitalea sp.]
MRVIFFSIIAACVVLSAPGCKRFLDYQPKGAVDGDSLNTPDKVDQMVISAYASLAADHWTVPYESQWPYGDVRAGDAYKGGGGVSDVGEYHQYETFTFNRPDIGTTDNLWFRCYVGIGRANDALKRINLLDESVYTVKAQRAAEMRFLRAHFYFTLKRNFKYMVWFDENFPKDSVNNLSNRAYTDQELWTKIADDFRFAADNLPESQSEIGRVNKWAAKAYLAKTLLSQAYVENDQHAVTSIDMDLLNQVVSLVDEVTPNYSLADDYSKNFLWDFDHDNPEIVFAVERSINDGTPNGNIAMAEALNYPMNKEYGCCWFHVPTQNLVNAFKTDNGLPEFETFNQVSLAAPADFLSNTVDPRLDHTVGIPTHPWKYVPTFVYDISWTRVPDVYGLFSSMKEAQLNTCPCYKKALSYSFYASSKNTTIIRFADVLLWKAEAFIELGRQDEALPIVNQIRERAKTSVSKLVTEGGDPISNYNIDTYKPGTNCTWTQEFARNALRWERRLELAMEGQRFYDLVRWGIAEPYMNKYFAEEKPRRAHLSEAHFTAGRDEYFPIPQKQINFTSGLYQQNPGYTN